MVLSSVTHLSASFEHLIISQSFDGSIQIWSDDRYRPKVFLSTIPTPIHGLKVKVTDLEVYKFLKHHF